MLEMMNRRRFFDRAGRLLLGGVAAATVPGAAAAVSIRTGKVTQATERSESGARGMTLFMCGDVMTGRGIDQVLPHPGDPALHEGYATSALDYVALAERANGPIPRPAEFAYVWGDALAEWARIAPDLRIVNLETAVTTRDEKKQGKGKQ